MSGVRRWDLVRVSMRLALLQSTWCEGGMQSVGLTYSLLPGLRRISRGTEELVANTQLHGQPFNTHPFLAGAVAGAALRLEEEGRAPEEIKAFLSGTMGPLAALGDPFFRVAFPFLGAVLASLAAFYGGALAGVVTMLLMFNFAHLLVRVGGVFVGYRESYDVLKWMARGLGPTRTRLLKITASLGAGLLIVAAVRRFDGGACAPEGLALTAFGVIAGLALTRWKSTQVAVILGLPAAAILAQVLP
jgi:mannose/fructose/N-acetylgalactosamine-specific phosphotransferase system component IID